MRLSLSEVYNNNRPIRCPYCGSVYSIRYWYKSDTVQFNYKEIDTRTGILGLEEWENVCSDCVSSQWPERKRVLPWIITCYRPTLISGRNALSFFVLNELEETIANRQNVS